MAQEILTTEKRILEAARTHFHEKGFAGARMQKIADEAGINKAMLHYYYRTKEQLFQAVFQQDIQKLMPEIIQILTSDLSLYQKIRQFADRYITNIQENPFLPGFVVHELSQNPERLVNMVAEQNAIQLEPFFNQVQREIDAGRIRAQDPRQLFVSLVSMCIFPFIGKPLVKMILAMDEEDFQTFLESRKAEVAESIIASIDKQENE